MELQSQTAGGEGVAHWGSVTQLTACLPAWGPLGRVCFFLCKTLCIPRCAPPSVHLGLFLGQLLCRGLMARERTTCSHRCPLPSSLPPSSAGPSLQLLTHRTTFLPLLRRRGLTERGTFPRNLSRGARSWCRGFVEPPVFLRNRLSSVPVAALPTPNPTRPIDVRVHGQ